MIAGEQCGWIDNFDSQKFKARMRTKTASY
ncbi:hypothetical protein [Dyadobacter sp. 676]|uniref:Transposase n=1 Tax=Dyadobacter sp. 676 TaxID=3088362 RepID=A0AAU8FTT5_9BACT